MSSSEKEWGAFYGDYVKTYLERDVRELAAVQDLNAFSEAMDFYPGGVRSHLPAEALHLKRFEESD